MMQPAKSTHTYQRPATTSHIHPHPPTSLQHTNTHTAKIEIPDQVPLNVISFIILWTPLEFTPNLIPPHPHQFCLNLNFHHQPKFHIQTQLRFSWPAKIPHNYPHPTKKFQYHQNKKLSIQNSGFQAKIFSFFGQFSNPKLHISGVFVPNLPFFDNVFVYNLFQWFQVSAWISFKYEIFW